MLYYELYVGGAVATQIIEDFGFSFTGYVMVSVIGNLVGAFASLVAGLADRWGRANLVVYGLFITAAIILFGLPHAPSKGWFTVLFALLSLVEGVILVATPALIRDFSPQLGRASAMGFWTLGPVLGSLIVTIVSSSTLDAYPNWRVQFYICGIFGMIVGVIAFFTLKELSPQLRDQIMVSLHDRALIEARAKNIDTEAALKNPWRPMLRLDVVGSAFAVSVFLLLYYILVGFFVLYMALNFGYSEADANALANWYWATNALTLVAAGFLSDKFMVRKPFMIIGAVISAIGTAIFAMTATTDSPPSTTTWVLILVTIAFGSGLAYTAWMASFTETVEKHNPAATATGLAIWGWIIRIVVTVSLFVFGYALPAVETLVEHGEHVSVLATEYQEQLAIVGGIEPDTLAQLSTDPATAAPQAIEQLIESGVATDEADAAEKLGFLGENPIPPENAAYLQEHAADVAAAAEANSGQWERWWWVCFAGQVVFIPFVFLMSGRWSPKKAREDAEEHEALVDRELAKMRRDGEVTDAEIAAAEA